MRERMKERESEREIANLKKSFQITRREVSFFLGKSCYTFFQLSFRLVFVLLVVFHGISSLFRLVVTLTLKNFVCQSIIQGRKKNI